MARNNEQPPIRCSFCGKRENQAARLIAGPGVYICSDCVEACADLLRQEIEMVRLENSIHEKTKFNIDQQQRDYYLREQMRAIRDELGEEEDDEFARLDRDIRSGQLSHAYILDGRE